MTTILFNLVLLALALDLIIVRKRRPRTKPKRSVQMKSRGDRIAQIYFNEPVNLVVVYDEFPDEVRDTERGESGFGSTGK